VQCTSLTAASELGAGCCISQAQLAWRLGDECQVLASRQHVDEAGLADVRPPNDCDFRHGGGRALLQLHTAADVFRPPNSQLAHLEVLEVDGLCGLFVSCKRDACSLTQAMCFLLAATIAFCEV